MTALKASRDSEYEGAAGSVDDAGWAASIALDSMSEAVFLIDRFRQIRHSNSQAQRLLCDHGGLTITMGRLGVTPEAARAPFIEHVRAVTARPANPDARIMLVGSFELRNRLLLKIRPAAIPSLAVVMASAYDQPRDVIWDLLRAPFGLTRAEAALATEMLTGRSLREAAQNLRVSYNTTRCQLSSVFEKVGVKRQHELVLTLSRFMG